ncbi:DUF6890 family protein [Proteus penneri]|nr:hypothetical protein [Proteus penneri]
MALRRHYLPHEQDDIDSFACAIWLDNHFTENHRIAVANGIALAFKGEL